MDCAPSILAGWPAAAPALGVAEREAAALGAMLRVARGLAQAGRRVELSGIDAMVGRVCARSLDLPPGDGRRMAPVLAGLLAELDALGSLIAEPG